MPRDPRLDDLAGIDAFEPEEGPAAGSRSRPLLVSEVNRLGREILEADLSGIWIVGEISNFKPHTSGHWYFCLKDEHAQINAVMFRSSNARVRFRPTDGMKVLAGGTVSLYEARGQYQILVEMMDRVGVGELQAAFEALKAKLRAEGLFDEARKRPLPALPRCVGIATSPSGAALKDILRVFEKRGADLRLLIAPCTVQGSTAAGEIVEAIRLLDARPEVEVIIVGRGGGSLEDLWPFNEEIVARAIAASRAPIVSAVGHEVDYTIADFAADLRAPTPSAAAEIVLRSRRELFDRVAAVKSALARSARLALARSRGRFDRAAHGRGMAIAESSLREALQRVDDLHARLERGAFAALGADRSRLSILEHRLSPRSLRAELQSRRERLALATALVARAARGAAGVAREKLSRTAGVLGSLSPLSVLERGYAICHDAASGEVVRIARRDLEGREVRVRLSKGALFCEVRRAEPEEP